MKKINLIGIRSVFVMLSIAGKCFAVVPPSTLLDEGAQVPANNASEKSAWRQSHPPLERIENDTQRLEEALHDLKEDYQDLRQSDEKIKRPQ